MSISRHTTALGNDNLCLQEPGPAISQTPPMVVNVIEAYVTRHVSSKVIFLHEKKKQKMVWPTRPSYLYIMLLLGMLEAFDSS